MREGGGGGLVLVVVARAAIDLADGAGIEVAEDFAKLADLEAPAGRGAERGSGGAGHGDFAGKRVAEAEQKIEERLVSGHAQQCVEQRREEEARDPPVKPALDTSCNDATRLGVMAQFNAREVFGCLSANHLPIVFRIEY